MPSNVEIKAKARDVEELKRRAKELSGKEGWILDILLTKWLTEFVIQNGKNGTLFYSGTLIEQEDTFFKVPNGRLKVLIKSHAILV